MPRDMAMHRPNTRIIREELENKVIWRTRRPSSRSDRRSSWWHSAVHQMHIPHLRIRWTRDGAIPLAVTLSQNPEVVAVEMHRMRDRCSNAVENQTNALSFVDLAVAVDVFLAWVLGPSLGGVEEDGFFPVGAEGGVVHDPDELASGVLDITHIDCCCDRWLRWKRSPEQSAQLQVRLDVDRRWVGVQDDAAEQASE